MHGDMLSTFFCKGKFHAHVEYADCFLLLTEIVTINDINKTFSALHACTVGHWLNVASSWFHCSR